MAIPLRLSTRRRTIIATATRLPPPYQVRGRNDKFCNFRGLAENSTPSPKL